MATVSAQDFLKGKKTVSLVAPASDNVGIEKSRDSSTAGFFSRVGSDLKKRGSDILSTMQETAKGNINPLETGIQVVGSVAGGVQDIGTEALKSTVGALPEGVKETAKNAGLKLLQTKIGQSAIQALSEGSDSYEQWKIANPNDAKNLESILNIASIFPFGSSGKAIGEGGEQILKTSAKIAKESANVTGRAVEQAGGKLIESAFRPDIAEAERLIAYKAKNPLINRIKASLTGEDLGAPITLADTATRHGLAGITEGQIGVQAKRAQSQVWSETINPALASIKEKLAKKEVLKDIKDIIMEEKELGKRKDMLDALQAVAEDYKHVNSWSYPTVQNIKSTLAKTVPDKVWRGKPIAGAYSNVRKIMSDVMREKIYSKIPAEARQAYLDYGNLGDIAARGAKALTEAQTRGGFGNFVSAVVDKLALPARTYGGQIIRKTGTALKKL